MVPSSYHAGGVNASMRSRVAGSKGVWGAMRGDAIEAAIMTRVTQAAITVTRDFLKLYQMSLSKKRWAVSLIRTVILIILTGGCTFFKSQSRIYDVIQDIHDQVDQHKEKSD